MRNVEARLLSQWQERRDGAAFEELVRPHLRFLCGFARRLGCAAADADDVVQRTLVRLAEDGSRKPAKVGLRAWLGRTLLSEVRMLFRSRKRRRRHERGAPPRGGPGDLGRLDDQDAVDAALARLPEKDRRAVVLRYLHDLDYDEVAHVLKTTRLAARLRVHRAVARLRKRIGRNAPAALAALPLLGGRAEARRALALGAARTAGAPVATSLVATGAVLMTTTAKTTFAAAGVLAVCLFAWTATDRPPRDVRRADRPAVLEATGAAAESAPDVPAPAGAPRDSSSEHARARGRPIPKGKGSVAGRITFTDGRPLRRTPVALSIGSPRVTCETDEDGRYLIHGEWVGRRSLVIAGPRKYAFAIGSATMRRDEIVTVDLTLERGVALEGTLRGPRGEAPAGARITLRRPGAHSGNVLQGGFGHLLADDEGRFRFDHLPPNATYTLQVEASGFEPLLHGFATRRADVGLDLELKVARPLVLRFENLPEGAGGQVSWMLHRTGRFDGFSTDGRPLLDARGEVRLDAPPAGRYRLTVFRGTWWPRTEREIEIPDAATPAPVVIVVPDGGPIEGMVRDAQGRALAGVRISVGRLPSQRTDAQGHFRLPHVARGRQEVRMYGDGSLNVLGEFDLPIQFLDLRAGGRASLRLELPADASPHEGFATLERDGRRVAEGRPGPYGRVEIHHLEPATYRLTMRAPGHAMDVRWIELHAAQELDLGRVELTPHVEVAVRATGVDRAVTLGVQASRRHEGPAGEVVFTGIDGRIELDGTGHGRLYGFPAGRHRVRIRGDGVEPFETEIAVDPESAVPLRIELPVR